MPARRWITIALSLAAIVLIGIIAADQFLKRETSGDGPVRSSGKALVGGHFTLTDHTGKRVTEADYRGKFMLVYFGYTFCPDVCPGELQIITAALDELGEKAGLVQPLLITVDPARDSAAQLADYVTNFHPSLIGLTGTAEEIAAAAKAYRVYYKKVEDEGGDPNAYLMDHSSIVYLMDREGEFLTHFTYGTPPDEIAKKIAGYLP